MTVWHILLICIGWFLATLSALSVDRRLNPQFWPDPKAPQCVCIIEEIDE